MALLLTVSSSSLLPASKLPKAVQAQLPKAIQAQLPEAAPAHLTGALAGDAGFDPLLLAALANKPVQELHKGWLEKKGATSVMKRWTRRWVEVKDRVLYYNKMDHDKQDHVNPLQRSERPSSAANLTDLSDTHTVTLDSSMVELESADWFSLAHTGHRRAQIDLASDEGRWVTP